jgi:hypothetical protein
MSAAQRARARKFVAALDAKRQARMRLTQGRFLVSFQECGNVKASAEAAGVDRDTVYRWLQVCPDFKVAYERALVDAVDVLEQAAWRRAVKGVLKPMVSAGSLVCHVREYSDSLLTTLLKGKKPDVYRERHEHMGKDGKPLFADVRTMPIEDLRAEFIQTAAVLGLKVVDAGD